MIVRLLGTGTSQGVPVINCDCEVCTSVNASDKRLRTSAIVSYKGTSVLIDAGPDFRQQILRTSIPRIDAVLFTHEHNDHVAGLDDLRPFVFAQDEDIPLFGLRRVLDSIVERFPYAFSKESYPGAPKFDLNCIIHGDSFIIGSIEVTAIEVIHGNLQILGYKLNSFVYITDAREIKQSSIDLIGEVDYMVVNALRRTEHWSHFNLKQALHFISKIPVKYATYITHVSHLMGLHEDVQKELPEKIYLAKDSLEICI